MTYDLAADCEYHPHDPRRGASTIWFPNGSRAKIPHGGPGSGLEGLAAVLVRSAWPNAGDGHTEAPEAT